MIQSQAHLAHDAYHAHYWQAHFAHNAFHAHYWSQSHLLFWRKKHKNRQHFILKGVCIHSPKFHFKLEGGLKIHSPIYFLFLRRCLKEQLSPELCYAK